MYSFIFCLAGKMIQAGMMVRWMRFLFSFFLLSLPAQVLYAGDLQTATTWGGQIKAIAGASDYSENSLQSSFRDDVWLDYGFSARVKTDLFLGGGVSVEGHYELVSLAGDSWEASGFYSSFSQKFSEDDATALLDLASEITSCREYAAWHRIDRLNVTLETGKSRVTLGRQAVTWGNGLLFNPMDVFNPFSPYDIERDYKKGNDMACVQMFLDSGDDFECLYVPRRDEKNGGIASEASSFAFKFHHFSGNMEFDIMAARHYDGALFGAGCSGYLGGAVWRADAVYASGGSLGDDYLNFVANIDYSWVWNGKNVYGFAEFFCSGLGEADCSEALLNEDLYTLVSRGEIFTWGRLYLAVNVDIEVTALLNAGVTVISNLDDGSSLLQPTMVWDAAENMEVTVGAGVGTGGSGDEYGQLEQPLSESPIDKGNTLFLWVTRFF